MIDLEQRKYIISAIFLLVFFAIFIKIFHLQVVDVSYKMSSENNSQRRIIQYPARGLIYDRNNILMVCNESAYDLMVIPNQVKNLDTLSFIKNLNISYDDFIKTFDNAKSYSRFRPSIFYKQMSATQYAYFQEQMYKYPGFFVQDRTLRKYVQGIAAHLLGNVGEVTQEIIDNDKYYRPGDYAGRSGIERTYEKYLRGEKGVQIYLVDVHNRLQGSYMNGIYDTIAIPGNNLKLTIDSKLQKYAEELMQNKKGAIVAIEPSTGEILSLVSAPTFNPQLLVGRDRGKNYDSLLNSIDRPLFNRAISASYPPGSVFKLANALIALQEGAIKENTSFPCDQSKVGCHPHLPASNVQKSIQYSCNPYYYFAMRNTIQRGIETSIFKDAHIGLDLWKQKMTSLGFEKIFDIGIYGENKGQIPGSDYYDKLYGKYRWAYSTIFSISIGQGEVLTTSLQLANFTSIVANRGYYVSPFLVKEIESKNLDLNSENEHKKIFTPFNKDYFEIIVEGMHDVLRIPGGTAYFSRIPDIEVCGKTGTVQNPHGENHSVFVAFAPKDKPQIAIAVFVENAGYGGTWAAPIATLMIEKYLKGEVQNKEKELRIMNSSLLVQEL